jgi:hypothetical protein
LREIMEKMGNTHMMRYTLRYCCLAAALTPISLSGCDSSGGKLTPVRGTVVYQGTHLSTGTIVFTPDEIRGTTGPLARAEIRPDGTYHLSTDNDSGARPGWYRVTIMAIDGPATSSGAGEFAAPRSLLPDKYRDPELSGLSCRVNADQENVIDFKLE